MLPFFKKQRPCLVTATAVGMCENSLGELSTYPLRNNNSPFLTKSDGRPERTLSLPQPVDQLSLTTLREMLIEIGAKVARHGR